MAIVPEDKIGLVTKKFIGGGQNGGGGPMEGLLGLQILDMVGKKINKEDDVKDVTSEEVKPSDKK